MKTYLTLLLFICGLAGINAQDLEPRYTDSNKKATTLSGGFGMYVPGGGSALKFGELNLNHEIKDRWSFGVLSSYGEYQGSETLDLFFFFERIDLDIQYFAIMPYLRYDLWRGNSWSVYTNMGYRLVQVSGDVTITTDSKVDFQHADDSDHGLYFNLGIQDFVSGNMLLKTEIGMGLPFEDDFGSWFTWRFGLGFRLN